MHCLGGLVGEWNMSLMRQSAALRPPRRLSVCVLRVTVPAQLDASMRDSMVSPSLTLFAIIPQRTTLFRGR